jgi:hypothetical protein
VWAVELRREESRCGLQDRVGPLQLAVLLLELLDPLGVARRRPGLAALVDVGLVDPVPHKFDAVAELAGDPLHGAVIGPELSSELTHQPDGLGLLLR